MPPAAAVTTTTSSAVIRARSRIAMVVRPVPIIVTAAASEAPSGMIWSRSTSQTARVA